MIDRQLLSHALHGKLDEFRRFASQQKDETRRLHAVLESLCERRSSDIFESIGSDPGAMPSIELDENDTFVVPFSSSWRNHEQARAWAKPVLESRNVFAADGSQLYLHKESSLPVGAVQIGWYQNDHAGGYEKRTELRVLSPAELLEDLEEPINPESRVAEARFHAEVERVSLFLEDSRGWKKRREKPPVAFFDNTLLISFSLPQTKIQESFVEATVTLVRLSRDAEVPLVGYVDRSLARDILGLLSASDLDSEPVSSTLFDTTFLSTTGTSGDRILKSWGDRTVFCYSGRKGLTAFTDPGTGKSLVGFTYLQTTADGPPARLDIPVWVYEEGMLDEVIDVIRAECVVGLGYPYCLEAADAAAVITNRDREIFLGALKELGDREGLKFSIGRKQASKARRR